MLSPPTYNAVAVDTLRSTAARGFATLAALDGKTLQSQVRLSSEAALSQKVHAGVLYVNMLNNSGELVEDHHTFIEYRNGKQQTSIRQSCANRCAAKLNMVDSKTTGLM